MAINIPYGYIIKSRKGNSYIKTPAGWMTNGKLANQGIIKNLEAAAERKIEQYNKDDKNPVKIGQEYKSNNGKVYFYNGTNFMSADGKKKLAGGAQESAMRKLQQAASANTPQPNDSIPLGFEVISLDDIRAIKSKNGWMAMGDSGAYDQPVNSPEEIKRLEDTAIQEMEEYNSTHDVKIGQTIEHNGQEYHFSGGNAFYTDSGDKLDGESSKQAYAELKQQDSGSSQSSSSSIPVGFEVISLDDIRAIKTKDGWSAMGDNGEYDKPVEDPEMIKRLEQTAVEEMDEYNNTHDVKIGQTIERDGKEYHFAGGKAFYSEDGEKLDDVSANQAFDEMSTTEGGDSQEASPETVSPESNHQEQPTQKSNKLQGLADVISKHPKKRKLIALLSRGDKISLMAADIILAGKADEAVKAIKAAQ